MKLFFARQVGVFRALSLLYLISVFQAVAESPQTLERNFAAPPASSRPWVYWFWLNGNITSNGITANLEAMKRVGIGGVLIMEVDQGAPKGPAGFGTPPWRQLFTHVCAEAYRLGLEVNMNNDAGWCGSGAPFITPDLAMQKLVWSETNVQGPLKFEAVLEQPKAVANYYRDIAVFAFPTPAVDVRISDLDGKGAFVPKYTRVTGSFQVLPADRTIARERIQVINSCLQSNGHCTWEVPAGKWTILRLGHTTTGKDNHPAPEAGRGLESDKLSKAATRVMFEGVMGQLIADSKPLAGNTLVSTHIDSWETGSQNWTPLFLEEFQKRRGYNPLLLLPILAGHVIDSVEISERFLWDVRQTVSDLLVENYAGEFRRLAHEGGLRLSIEAYDGTPCDDMTYAGQADEPMAEFWSWGYNTAYSCLEMSSAAHVYGKRILGAEAFTANDQEKWQHHPATIKTLGDWAFCEGINRFVFHRYALQPWTDRAPGMSMGPWGLHYERTQTWWDQSVAWHEYLARCQYLLRQGLFVVDICFLQPEGSPRRFSPTMAWRDGNTPERPRYNFDGCTPEVVLNRMEVAAGRLVLPDGMSYQVLVLPQVDTMTPQLLRKIAELVEAGATVVGRWPTFSPSLANYPQCDSEVRLLAANTWPTPSSDPNTKLSAPENKVIWDESFETPNAGLPVDSPLKLAKWIWHNEGNPADAVPVGERFFRRIVVLDPKRVLSAAELVLTVDNSFEVWINGKSVGSGDNFKQSFRFDAKPFLKSGANLITVKAVNGSEAPNPAGLIAAFKVRFKDGAPLELFSDREWQTSIKPPAAWLTAAGSNELWGAARELGPLGMRPWGELDKPSDAPYVFPKFEAIAALLKKTGLPPDFEADPSLRFIHRRDGASDIYFVANSQTNWLRANCVFRVSGKQPEIWNPINGEVVRTVPFQEKGGQTFVPLNFEPAGSLFVIFREHFLADRTEPITTITLDGRGVLPEPGQILDGAPPVEFVSAKGRSANLLAWQPGNYEVKFADGKLRPMLIPSLPAAVEIQGPWEVRFQSNRGAPDKLSFEKLVDWSHHENPGVRYFSGTATYTKTFDLTRELLAPDSRVFLDLGAVPVMAQVSLNGKDLGILWKSPYRVDVTPALRTGENRLEIKVVNLWINRMIGDEQLPEDSARNPDGTLKEWPSWLGTDEPSPAGRSMFTSWRLWKKDSPLQPSGLLGPVRLIPAKLISL